MDEIMDKTKMVDPGTNPFAPEKCTNHNTNSSKVIEALTKKTFTEALKKLLNNNTNM